MGESIYRLIMTVFWMICIPIDIGAAIEHYKHGRHYRCGIDIMLAVFGLIFITKTMFTG